jgi:hypothetical protein
MTYEETHESDNESESDSEIETESIIVSVTGSNASVKRISNKDALYSDPDYHVLTCRVGKKMKNIAMYSTHWNPGRLIRDPVFGTHSKDRVGTLAERDYFKVRMTSIGDGLNTITLYYDCPEAYEKHLRTKVSYEIKTTWRNRNNI